MDRPQHRRTLLPGLALLAGGVLLLLGWQWMSQPELIIVEAKLPAREVAEPAPSKPEPPTPETAAPSAPAPPPPAAPAQPDTGFRGRVIDAVTRQPVREFEVQLIRIERQGLGVNQVDKPVTRPFQSKNGRFVWSDVAAGTWRVSVSARGYQTFNVGELTIEPGKATAEGVMPLLRGLAVRGRVFELSTGAGIPDAWITFEPVRDTDSFMRTRASAKSQDDGSFTLDGLPRGEIVLTVGAEKHAFSRQVLVVDEKTPPQEIALSAGGTIAGIVTTTSGVPVKGRVWLYGPGPGYGGESNDAGEFSYEHMPAGRYRVAADTSAGSARQEFMLQQDEVKDGIVLVVGAGRSIRGMIRGTRPERIKSTHLFLRTQSRGLSLSTKPDERGAYAFNGVPAGRATISVFGSGLQFDKKVDVPADQDVTLDIVFPTGATLSGRVTQAGKPAAHKSVRMRPAAARDDLMYRTTTSEDGLYEIEGLPAGDYRLRADEDISREISIAGDTVLNIDIPSVQLSARVLESGGSVPIVGANIYLRGSAPETARVWSEKQTDDFGQFALTGIEPGEVVLLVYKPGYELYREKIAYSAPITNKTISLSKSAGVDVHVRPGSRRFPIGFTITQSFASPDYVVDIWVPLDADRVGHVPSALAGTTFQIGRFSGKPLVFEDWDGQPFELP